MPRGGGRIIRVDQGGLRGKWLELSGLEFPNWVTVPGYREEVTLGSHPARLEKEMKLGREGFFSVQEWAHCSQSSKENQDSCLNGERSFLTLCPLMVPVRPVPLGPVE